MSTKSGYEVRAEILSMAKDLLTEEFHSKYGGWELSTQKDEHGRVVSLADMPSFPTLGRVIQTAEKMYAFVEKVSA